MRAIKKTYVYPGGGTITYLYLFSDKGKCTNRLVIKKEVVKTYVTRVI